MPPMPAHLPSITPNLAPGAMFVRVCTDDSQVLAEHPVAADVEPDVVAQEDRDVAFDWLREHPRAVVFAYVYDGSSGACSDLTFLAASDVRAHDKRNQPDEDELLDRLRAFAPQ